MSSITFQYRSSKNAAKIEARLNYKAGNKRKSQYTRVNFEVSREFWEEYKAGVKFRDISKTNLKRDLENHLQALKDFLEDRFIPSEDYPSGWLKDAVKSFYNPLEEEHIPDDLLKYFDYYLDLREAEVRPQYQTWLKWNEIRNKTECFIKDTGKGFKIKDVNDEFKKLWIEWGEAEKYAAATIRKNFSYIKQVCLHAGTKGIKTSPELPRLSVKLKTEKTPKIYLSFSELEKVKTAKGLPEYLDNARDWVLISCYTGQRISDFMRYTPDMIRLSKGRKYLDIRQQKTGKDITIPLLPEVLEILDKRKGHFPRRISHQKYNDYIKEVCKKAGITQKIKGKVTQVIKVNGKNRKRDIIGTYEKWKLIASHAGRRSFATNYYGKIPTTYIKNITGHSTEAMLLRYIGKTSSDTAYEAFDLMLNVNK